MSSSILCFLLALLITSPVPSNASSLVSGEFDCDSHDAAAALQSLSGGTNCLSMLKENPERFDICKDEICYLFLIEEPFIIFDEQVLNNTTQAAFQYQTPFKCGEPATLHPSLRGIAFALHNKTSSRDSSCVWGGHPSQCSFNALVEFTEVMASEGYQFAITGLLLETPQRQCTHDPSAPFIDNAMIIIGSSRDDKSLAPGPVYQLTQPFRAGAWGIFAAFILLFIIVCLAIAVRFHVFRGRSLITAFFIFAGERDEAMAHENDMQSRNARLYREQVRYNTVRRRILGDKSAGEHKVTHDVTPQKSYASSFATKYGLSMTLFRIALVAFAGIFALFYEVAVVNFLFQQQSLELSKSVKSLSVSELQQYSVLKNSALENVWNASVNPRGLKYDGSKADQIPWERCSSGRQCIEWAADRSHPVRFDVTFEIVGKHLIKTVSDCRKLTVFRTKDILYNFNAGWLYNRNVDQTLKKQIDREIVALRINGTIRDLIDEEIGDLKCGDNASPDIGPLIILIPCSLFVLPPLLCSVLVLLCWKKPKQNRTNAMNEQVNKAGEKKEEGGTEKQSNSSADSTRVVMDNAAVSGDAENFTGPESSTAMWV